MVAMPAALKADDGGEGRVRTSVDLSSLDLFRRLVCGKLIELPPLEHRPNNLDNFLEVTCGKLGEICETPKSQKSCSTMGHMVGFGHFWGNYGET